MTKAQLEERVSELEGKLAKAEVTADTATQLKDLAMEELKDEKAKNTRLKGVLKDLLVNEDLEAED